MLSHDGGKEESLMSPTDYGLWTSVRQDALAEVSPDALVKVFNRLFPTTVSGGQELLHLVVIHTILTDRKTQL